MATVTVSSPVSPRKMDYRGVYVNEWTPLTTTNTDGSWIELPRHSDRSVHVSGTFGVGGSVRIQGTNQVDGSGLPINPVALSDQGGTALDITAASIKTVLQTSRFIRPLVTAGDGTTSLTVTLISKGDDL